MKNYGGFNARGDEYIISNPVLPRKWNNFIWNSNFLCEVDHDGFGKSFYKHPGGLRSELVKGRRIVYIRDLDNGEYWAFPGHGIEGNTVHGLGYTVFNAEKDGIKASLRVTVPDEAKGEGWKITIVNTSAEISGKRRRISVFTCADLELAGYPTPFGCKWSIPVRYDRDLNGLIFINNDAGCPADYYNAYVLADNNFTAFETVPEKFFGIGRGSGNPVSVEKGKCENTLNAGGGEFVGVFQFDAELGQGETKELNILYGVFEEIDEVRGVRRKFIEEGSLDAFLDEYRQSEEKYLTGIEINTPDIEINRLLNYWTKHNLKLTSQWTRVYSRGFRDTLQDTAGIASLDTRLARANILEAMNNIFRSGKCVRAWDTTAGALKDEFYADGPVWIPLAVNAYVAETGDTGLLDEVCSYLDGGSGTVLEHMAAALRFLYEDSGVHGLSHIHDGDWCDTAHLLGKKGRGEGVWLSIALYNALMEVLRLADHIGDTGLADEMARMADTVRKSVNSAGWDGEWFLIAYNDEGRKVGSHECREGRIFLNPQSWAVISGITTPERQDACLKAIDKHLDTWVGPLLLTPAFTEKDPGIGSITGFYPGTIENGSCYCHAAAFKIVADCIAGRGGKAYETLRKIMPGGSADAANPEADCPPYAFTNCRFAPDHPYLAGRMFQAWLTGTVSWCWQALTEWMLGARRTFNGLMVDPCIPQEWDGYTIKRTYRGSIYNIIVSNPGHVQRGVREILVDGRPLKGNVLPVTQGRVHDVRVLMG